MSAAPHIPGRNARPPEGSIAPGLDEGLALYRAGYFWEAHEAWEPVWMKTPADSTERALLQGLIQIANGRLKLVMGRAKAALRIAALAKVHLDEAEADELTDWARREVESVERDAIADSAL